MGFPHFILHSRTKKIETIGNMLRMEEEGEWKGVNGYLELKEEETCNHKPGLLYPV